MTANADRRRYVEIARGCALECAAIQDVLMVGLALDSVQHRERKVYLDRIAAILSKLGGRGYRVTEQSPGYEKNDPDPDFDRDFDNGKCQPAHPENWLVNSSTPDASVVPGE